MATPDIRALSDTSTYLEGLDRIRQRCAAQIKQRVADYRRRVADAAREALETLTTGDLPEDTDWSDTDTTTGMLEALTLRDLHAITHGMHSALTQAGVELAEKIETEQMIARRQNRTTDKNRVQQLYEYLQFMRLHGNTELLLHPTEAERLLHRMPTAENEACDRLTPLFQALQEGEVLLRQPAEEGEGALEMQQFQRVYITPKRVPILLEFTPGCCNQDAFGRNGPHIFRVQEREERSFPFFPERTTPLFESQSQRLPQIQNVFDRRTSYWAVERISRGGKKRGSLHCPGIYTTLGDQEEAWHSLLDPRLEAYQLRPDLLPNHVWAKYILRSNEGKNAAGTRLYT